MKETMIEAALRLQDQQRNQQQDDAAVLLEILAELKALRKDLAKAVDAL